MKICAWCKGELQHGEKTTEDGEGGLLHSATLDCAEDLKERLKDATSKLESAKATHGEIQKTLLRRVEYLELQIRELVTEVRWMPEVVREVSMDSIEHARADNVEGMLERILPTSEKRKGEAGGGGYGEVCSGCGLLVRITCRCA